MSALPLVHVVAAAMVDATGAVLIQRRADDAHQGGLWEFPGGKLEPAEAPWPGLVRELYEELGIQALRGRPLIAVRHDYPDRRVSLDVWKVDQWRGHPAPLEGQPLRWVQPSRLADFTMPAADRPVVGALRLPDRYLITPQPERAGEDWVRALRRAIAAGAPLIQLRAVGLDAAVYRQLALDTLQWVRDAGSATRVLLNAEPELAMELGADGVHLNALRVAALRARPLPEDRLVGASCHNAQELESAARLGVDFAVLGPLNPTVSHPGAPSLGWPAFKALTRDARIPVYALGGVGAGDLCTAWEAGGQGIAAIRALWPSEGNEECTKEALNKSMHGLLRDGK